MTIAPAPSPDPVILLFAAGASRRMQGLDKLMQLVGNEALVRRQARAAVASGLPVMALVSPEFPARSASLKGLPLAQVTVENAADGMSASLRAGINALPQDTPAAIMMLADMPEIGAGDIALLTAAWRAAPARPHRLSTQGGMAGSPVIFPARLFDALTQLQGDVGGKSVLEGEDVGLVQCPDNRALVDLDTPEDWAMWRRLHHM